MYVDSSADDGKASALKPFDHETVRSAMLAELTSTDEDSWPVEMIQANNLMRVLFDTLELVNRLPELVALIKNQGEVYGLHECSSTEIHSMLSRIVDNVRINHRILLAELARRIPAHELQMYIALVLTPCERTYPLVTFLRDKMNIEAPLGQLSHHS